MHIDPGDVSICVGEGAFPTGFACQPTSPPIVQTSLFYFPTYQALVEGLATQDRHQVYTRGRNPTAAALERKLAVLDTDVAAVRCAMRPATRLLLLKSPGTMLFRWSGVIDPRGQASDIAPEAASPMVFRWVRSTREPMGIVSIKCLLWTASMHSILGSRGRRSEWKPAGPETEVASERARKAFRLWHS